MEHSFFYLGMAFILLHELDAIRCHEWRIFPGLAGMKEELARPIFIWVHLPLFYFLLLGLSLENELAVYRFVKGLNIFFIVHTGLHILFLRHPNNEFKDWMSWSFILGAGSCGILDLIFK